MKTRIIGIGAAGNKAAISAVEANIDKLENILLINSTLKDIPHDFQGKKFCFTDAYGGCGKERKKAKELMMKDLESGALNIEEFLGIGTPEKAEVVVLVSSTEGGTGSGAVPVLAYYIQNVLKIRRVHCFAFTGFEEDARGLMNTVEYFQEMEENFTVECLQNSKFMKECNNNRIKAEAAANAEFCRKISILFGNPLRDSDHNIDPTDLLKVATTPGYMVIEFTEFRKIKNREEFREMVERIIDDSKTLDLNERSQRRIAVMINIDKSSTDIIDYQDILIDRFGSCFEKFEHIQHEDDMPEFFAFVSAGLKIPVKEIETVYEKYQQYTSKVDKQKDSFFSKKFDFDDQDSMFDLEDESPAMDKNAFFSGAFTKKSGIGTGRKKSNDDVEDAY